MYPIRFSTCNLHGKNNKAGITVLIPHIKAKQYVLSLPTVHQYNGETDLWLESGSVSLGPVTVNSAMALEYPELRRLQDSFLKCHDRRSCRLNFLWPADDGDVLADDGDVLAGKCGCVGGCMFFGSNRRETRVFRPSDSDMRLGINSVVYHLVEGDTETALGFGQSILHSGEFIFYTPSIPSSEDTLKAFQRLDECDGDTGRSSLTLVEQDSRKSLLCLSESSRGSAADNDFTMQTGTNAGGELSPDARGDSSRVVDSGIFRNKPRPADRPLSDGLRESWDTGSVFVRDISLLDTQDLLRPQHAVDGDDICQFASGSSPNQGALSHGSPACVRRHDSLSSIRSLSTSQPSSLTSPALQRLSSEASIQKGSSPSVTGSERYFSCTEDADLVSNRGYDSTSPLSDYQVASPGGSQIVDDSFWFSHDDDPVTRTVIMMDNDSSDDSASSFVSASSFTVNRRKKSHRGSMRRGDLNTTLELSNESQPMSEPDDSGLLFDDTITPDSPNVTDYVNLHNQISQPITRSPVMISSYVGHMTQLKCTHWAALAPVPHLVSNTSSTLGRRFLSSSSTIVPPSGKKSVSLLTPRFAVVQPGFTSVMMAAKKEALFSRMPSDSADSEQDVNMESGRPTDVADDLSEIGMSLLIVGIALFVCIVAIMYRTVVEISPDFMFYYIHIRLTN